MKKSEIMQIIKEEVEVVLTNEEANEMFDLNMSALLDEMMNEVEEELDEKKNWLKKIKSTGKCTPFTKRGCKGRAKAFARRAQDPEGDIRVAAEKGGENPHGPG